LAAPFIKTSFAHGEIAPSLFGHVDLPLWGSAAGTCRNLFVGYRGGAYSRAGTAYCGRSKQRPDLGQAKPRLVPFQFSISQGLALEFGDNYCRFLSAGGYVVEAPVAVSGVTQANPGVVNSTAHGFSNGDWVAFAGLGGMLQLNGQVAIVGSATTNAFTLENLDGGPLDTTLYLAYTSGGTASRLYTLPTPYAAADLPLLKWVQSADVMSFTHPNYPPQELSRLGPTNWSMAPLLLGARVSPPGSVTVIATVQPNATATPPTLPCAYAYCVTSIDPKTGQESVASGIAQVTNGVDMAVTAGSNVVQWTNVPAAGQYRIYRSPPGYNTGGSNTNSLPIPAGTIFGFVGSSFGNQFVDANDVTADFTQTPPLHKDPFAPGQVTAVTINATSGDWTVATVAMSSATGSGFQGQVVFSPSNGGLIVAVIILNGGKKYQPGDTLVFSGNGTSVTATPTIGPQSGTYPGVVSYFQERRAYAQTINNPDTIWFSQPDAFLDFDTAVPVVDTDAITATPWSQRVDGVQWMQSMPLGLVTFTGDEVWQVTASQNFISSPSPITPSNLIAVRQGSSGASASVPPQKINWDLLYVSAKGFTVRSLTYQVYLNIYSGVDISWPSSHLLIGHQIQEWAWCEEPYRVQWMVRDDGILLSLTWLKEQEVAGWARHDTQGQVRSVCAVVEPPVDALYLVVERPVAAGFTRFFVERMDNRIWRGLEDSWCVDCAIGTALPLPNAMLAASAASGSGVNFISSPGIFSSAAVGQIIRMGGGIALVTGYTGPSQVTGNWLTPCRQILPNDPSGTPIVQAAGAWSLAAPITTVYGLSHLAGRQVVGLADGIPVGLRTVAADGSVVLDRAASNVRLGLGFAAQLQSVYLDTGMPTIQGQRKAISAATVRVEASASLQCGANQADSSTLLPSPLFSNWALPPAVRAAEAPPSYTTASGGTVFPLFTGDVIARVPASWQKPGQIAVQQLLPLPLNVLAFVPQILPGDVPEVGYGQRPQGQPAGGRGQPAARPAARAGPDDLEMAEMAQQAGFRR